MSIYVIATINRGEEKVMFSISSVVRKLSVFVAALSIAHSVTAQEVNLSRNEKATEQAIASSLLIDIYKRAGITAKVQAVPAARANAAALSGEKDGEVGRIQAYATKNPTLVKVEPPYYYITTAVFAKADRGITVASKDDLKKYKVGIVRGVAHTEAATAGLAGVQVAGDAEQMFQMLDAGRIDIALDAGVNGPYVTKKLGLSGIKQVGEVAKLDLFAILAPGKKDLAPKLSATIKSLKDSGELDKLIKKHEEDFHKSGASN
jgi:ABC-type amino acid transport substrate-binding protein